MTRDDRPARSRAPGAAQARRGRRLALARGSPAGPSRSPAGALARPLDLSREPPRPGTAPGPARTRSLGRADRPVTSAGPRPGDELAADLDTLSRTAGTGCSATAAPASTCARSRASSTATGGSRAGLGSAKPGQRLLEDRRGTAPRASSWHSTPIPPSQTRWISRYDGGRFSRSADVYAGLARVAAPGWNCSRIQLAGELERRRARPARRTGRGSRAAPRRRP